MTPEEIAAQISNTQDVPIDVRAVAHKNGIKILEGSLEQAHLSALLVYKNGKYFIGVNESHPEQRKRFSIAHELGHYFLHRKMFHMDAEPDEGFIMFRDINSALGIKKEEIEANVFAANLLMPKAIFQEQWKNGDLASLAKFFDVSLKAAKFRCKNLGLDCDE